MYSKYSALSQDQQNVFLNQILALVDVPVQIMRNELQRQDPFLLVEGNCVQFRNNKDLALFFSSPWLFI
jgi:hypothetical protein